MAFFMFYFDLLRVFFSFFFSLFSLCVLHQNFPYFAPPWFTQTIEGTPEMDLQMNFLLALVDKGMVAFVCLLLLHYYFNPYYFIYIWILGDSEIPILFFENEVFMLNSFVYYSRFLDTVSNVFKSMLLSHDEHELSTMLDLPSPTDQVDHEFAFGSKIPR